MRITLHIGRITVTIILNATTATRPRSNGCYKITAIYEANRFLQYSSFIYYIVNNNPCQL